jgi:hypothetical protein
MPKLVTPLALFVGTLIFAAFSTRELWNDGMLVFGDLTKFPSEASVYLDGIREAWSDRGLGGVFPSSAFSLLPALLLLVTFGNETLAQQLHMTLWIPVAFFGMAYLCRRFIETSWFLAAVGGAVYVATPVSIGLFVAGAGGLIWAYALAPLVIVGVEMVHRRGFAGLAWFALAAALVAVPSVELLTFGLLALLVWLPLSRDRDRLALAGAGALALAIVTALPSLAGRGGTRLSSELVEKMTVDFQFTYSEITPQMLARLAGNRGDPMAPLGYNSWESWTFAGYLPLAALVIGLALRRRGDFFPIRTTALGLVTAGLLVVIAYAAEARPGVFEDFSPSFVFRNPEKLMILLAAALVPGAVYGLHRMFEVYPQHRGALTVGVVAGLLAYLGVYASPALTGHWGVATVRESYRADPALEASAQYIDKAEPSLEGRWRVVWLPFQHEDVLNLEWILPQWANEPVLERRDPEVVETSRLLQDALAESDMRRFHAIADRASVRYVVLRANPDAAPLRQALASDPDSKRVYSGRGFVIWRNTAALPRIRSFSALEAVATTDRERAVRYTSAPIVTLRPSALSDAGGWSAHPGENFSRVGPAIRIQATSSRLWPVLAQRIRVDGAATYVISAWVRTRNAADAHLKVIWYRRSGAPEVNALAHSYAQPRLSGNRGWTRVSGVVTSPAAATFAEVAFLAGRLREGSRRSAVTWVRDIRMVNRYVGDLPTTTTDAVVDVSPDLAQPNHELVLAGSAAELGAEDGATSVPVTPVVVNPTAGSTMPPALEPLVERRRYGRHRSASITAVKSGGSSD